MYTRRESSAPNGSSSSAPKRTSNACQRCRRRKIKCSGQDPCRNCENLGHQCVFSEADRRIVISERRLRELQQRVTEGNSGEPVKQPHCQEDRRLSSPTPKPQRSKTVEDSLNTTLTHQNTPPLASISARDNPHGATQDEAERITNPLTAGPSRFAIDSSGRQRYLGHTSTWSFSRQVRSLLKAHLGPTAGVLHDEIPCSEGAVYGISAAIDDSRQHYEPPDLPLQEYVQYIFSSFLFHMGSVYNVLDRENFQEKLNEYFNAPKESRSMPKLQYAQMLLVVAFGKLFIGRQANEFGPPGSDFCVAAVRLLPSMTQMIQQPLIAIEVLSLIALYLQCAGTRNSAYVYAGTALRIALSIGMNRLIHPESLEPRQYTHRLHLWWSLYILNRRLSTLMGAPLALNDQSDIDVPLPEDCQILALHVKLSQLLGKVITSVYRLNDRLDKPFLENIQEILSIMTTLRVELDEKAPLYTSVKSGLISRNCATLHLKYHQCAVLATRPLLFHLIQKRMASSIGTDYEIRELSDAVKALVGTSVDAAGASSAILSSLHEQDLFEMFLPFDADATFSSAFVVAMVPMIKSSNGSGSRALDIASYILHDMAGRGNLAVISYEMELDELKRMSTYLLNQHLANSQPRNETTEAPGNFPSLTFDVNFGAMQSAVDILDDEFFNGVSFDIPDDVWLFADEETGLLGHGTHHTI